MTAALTIQLAPVTADGGPLWSVFAAGDFGLTGWLAEGRCDGDRFDSLVDRGVAETVRSCDLAIANFEGAIGVEREPPPKVGPVVEMDRGAVSLLRHVGFGVVSMANNHVMDYGAEGLLEGMRLCREQGIKTCGAGQSLDEALGPAWVRVAGLRVAVLGLCEQEFGAADAGRAGTAPISDPQAMLRVAAVSREADVVIVVAHGGVEYAPFSPIQRQRQLEALVDAGASLVIGHHPHVPQGWQRRGDGLILHSLGNFHFWHGRHPWAFHSGGMGVRVRLQGRRVTALDLYPVQTDRNWIMGFMPPGERRERLLLHVGRLAEILGGRDGGEAYWRETARVLWRRKYRRLLADAMGVGCKARLRWALRPLVRRCRRWRGGELPLVNMPRWLERDLLRMSLFRTESHRWTIQTALEVLAEGCPGSPEVSQEVERLMGFRWSE